jgi:tetratricopeptide (TPR) repeat protein
LRAIACNCYDKPIMAKHMGFIRIRRFAFACCIKSRPALSLLGYCYYQTKDFVNAADCYEQLTFLFPDIEIYRLYYAQSLYKASIFDEATKVSHQIDNAQYRLQVRLICAVIVLPYVFRRLSAGISSLFETFVQPNPHNGMYVGRQFMIGSKQLGELYGQAYDLTE